jgi:quinol monooxygenase YgiN
MLLVVAGLGFALVVRFSLLAGSEAAFDRLVSETVTLIGEREPGTLMYVVHEVEGDPGRRVFYELYRDRAAFEEHEEQRHVRRFLAERGQYLSQPPEVEFLTARLGAGPVAAWPDRGG